MGILDKVKDLIGGNKKAAKDGVDKAAGAAKGVVGDKHEGKVDDVADKAKDAIDKLPGEK